MIMWLMKSPKSFEKIAILKNMTAVIIFLIWPILEPSGENQKMISFSFWFKQENLLLKFTDL